MMTPDLSNLGTTVGSTTAKTSPTTPPIPRLPRTGFSSSSWRRSTTRIRSTRWTTPRLTTQMAQINTVSGIRNKRHAQGHGRPDDGGTQSLQGASLIGRDVLMDGDTLQFEGSVGGARCRCLRRPARFMWTSWAPTAKSSSTVDMGARGAEPFV
ncbi:MAG: hypothetical protein R3E42_06930 [Burkholderiaceae bacterium]